MSKELIAHVKRLNDGTWLKPHLLMDHLTGTAYLAEQFSAKFHSASWGKAVGYCHDVGKGLMEWQEYLKLQSGYGYDDAHLEGQYGKKQHAIYGAKLAEQLYGKAYGRLIAYCISGHHAGLPDWSAAEGSGQSSLEFRMNQCKDLTGIVDELIGIVNASKPDQPPWCFDDSLDLSLWVRMLFSCLVDADFLDTEAYMEPGKSELRGKHLSLNEYLHTLNTYITDLENNAEATAVNILRKQVRTRCSQMGTSEQGIFRLTVPTGGGKTLSSVAFALEHAVKHNLDRIIYVIPYTSIIEQNADVFRKVFGNENVVEHHSNLTDNDTTPRTRIAAENWDAPLIITTAVQFFESLFAAKPGRCRKLHNIANSVIILDEAQLTPINFLEPILQTLQLLVDRYGVSIVLCTATQPAFDNEYLLDRKFSGLRNVIEIMGNQTEELFKKLNRVKVELPSDLNIPVEWSDIAEDLKQYKQVLCIVSDRRSCRELHTLMPEGTYHLSSLMCGQHRSNLIAEIKGKLLHGDTVRVISTQLVEAGVDFDFPIVFRSFAGLDSLAQAAGRCNREGRLPELGKLVVFVPTKKAPAGYLRKAAETAFNMLVADSRNPLDIKRFKKYFSELYWKTNSLDQKEIVDLLRPKNRSELSMFFRTAANNFKIIDDSMQETIVVPYRDGKDLMKLIGKCGPNRELMRKLQRYTVNIYKNEFIDLLNGGNIVEVHKGIYYLNNDNLYKREVGLQINMDLYEPGSFII
jgi:CRISPR-associated endonuclease/helicase Cas3